MSSLDSPDCPSGCKLIHRCSGCEWLDRPYAAQLAEKAAQLRARLAAVGLSPPPGFEIVSAGQERLRERADLTWSRDSRGRLALGLYDLTRAGEIVDMEACPQMSEPLEEWLACFRSLPPPLIQKGSVRLRVSPAGKRGVWLDLANEDVKVLLEESSWLERLRAEAQVEIGQRFKPLVREGEKLRLAKELRPEPWFETYVGASLEPVALYGTIGSFTQPGRAANRLLVSTVLEALAQVETGRALELFSGLGNFTLPLAALGHEISAYEVDATSVTCFAETLRARPELESRVRTNQRNLYAARASLPHAAGFDLLFVDPPRSGMRESLALLSAPETRPLHLVYVSCFAESLVSDLAQLRGLGYELRFLKGVDQFPQTPHCEWVARLERVP